MNDDLFLPWAHDCAANRHSFNLDKPSEDLVALRCLVFQVAVLLLLRCHSMELPFPSRRLFGGSNQWIFAGYSSALSASADDSPSSESSSILSSTFLVSSSICVFTGPLFEISPRDKCGGDWDRREDVMSFSHGDVSVWRVTSEASRDMVVDTCISSCLRALLALPSSSLGCEGSFSTGRLQIS